MGAAFRRIKRGAVSRYSQTAWDRPAAQSNPDPTRETADVDTPMAAARAAARKAARERAEHPHRGRVARDPAAHWRARTQRPRRRQAAAGRIRLPARIADSRLAASL